jgi:hypothetical protein
MEKQRKKAEAVCAEEESGVEGVLMLIFLQVNLCSQVSNVNELICSYWHY